LLEKYVMGLCTLGRDRKIGSAREFEKPPIGGDLSVLPFLGFPAVGSGPQATNQDGKLPKYVLWGRGAAVIGRISEGADNGRNSFLARDFVASRPSRIRWVLDLAPSIRLQWRAERAGRPVCPSGERPPTAPGKRRATVADGNSKWKSAPSSAWCKSEF
jgi:hypothetical protein